MTETPLIREFHADHARVGDPVAGDALAAARVTWVAHGSRRQMRGSRAVGHRGCKVVGEPRGGSEALSCRPGVPSPSRK